MSGQDGSASGTSRPPRIPAPAAAEQAAEQSVVADYTETVVPAGARRSNFRMLLTFGSMQLVFGAVLVGYDARFQGLSLGRLIVAMAIAAATMTVYCIGSANLHGRPDPWHVRIRQDLYRLPGAAGLGDRRGRVHRRCRAGGEKLQGQGAARLLPGGAA